MTEQQTILKKKLGRPASAIPVKAKSWSFYESDVNYILNKGLKPKEILKIGVEAHNKNLVVYIRELEENIEKYQKKLIDLTNSKFKKAKKKK